MKLAEIAAKIADHLTRIERESATKEKKCASYYKSVSWAAGRYVNVRYVSYQLTTSLSKADAIGYLAWLDAGNVGRHYEWQRAIIKGEGKNEN